MPMFSSAIVFLDQNDFKDTEVDVGIAGGKVNASLVGASVVTPLIASLLRVPLHPNHAIHVDSGE